MALQIIFYTSPYPSRISAMLPLGSNVVACVRFGDSRPTTRFGFVSEFSCSLLTTESSFSESTCAPRAPESPFSESRCKLFTPESPFSESNWARRPVESPPKIRAALGITRISGGGVIAILWIIVAIFYHCLQILQWGAALPPLTAFWGHGTMAAWSSGKPGTACQKRADKSLATTYQPWQTN